MKHEPEGETWGAKWSEGAVRTVHHSVAPFRVAFSPLAFLVFFALVSFAPATGQSLSETSRSKSRPALGEPIRLSCPPAPVPPLDRPRHSHLAALAKAGQIGANLVYEPRSEEMRASSSEVAGEVVTEATPLETKATGNPSALETMLRGITLSTHRGNQEWDSDQLAPTFIEMRETGANWVAIHPYAGIRATGEVRTWGVVTSEAPGYIARPIREAHQEGLKILVKPHLAYWGSKFAWRGEIEFETEDEWQRFFEEYTEWIVRLADQSKGADAFAVGTELDKTLHREKEWREVISRIRAVTKASLTYAANWPDYQRVPFWDALDQVGIQAYFPLSKVDKPSRAELEASWKRLATELGEFSRKVERKILFTELGYNRSYGAAREPWKDTTDDEAAEELQRMCLAVALETVAKEPHLAGAFLWKWFLKPRSVGRDFQMASPGMRETIREAWGVTESAGRGREP